MITPERLAALRLMDHEGIEKEIEELRGLQQLMVGTLYPSIIESEIAELEMIYVDKRKEGPK